MADTKVKTGKVRFSYVNIFSPRKADDSAEPKYSMTLLVPKSDTVTYQAMKRAIKAAIQTKPEIFKGLTEQEIQTPIHDGDGRKPKGGAYGEECKGCWVVNTSSKNKPGVVDINKEPITDPTEVYSGCYGRVTINAYAYNRNGNKGISFGLNNVQKRADGAPLDGRVSAEDDFDDDFQDSFDDDFEI